MRDAVRIAAVGAVDSVLFALGSATSATAMGPATVEPTDTAPTTEAPADTTEPQAEETAPGDTLVAAGEPDPDIDGTVAAIAVVGFLALLGLAGWWMVRRPNPDAEPMPPVPPSGPPPTDLI